MMWCRPIRDRRSLRRPRNGDRIACPKCGADSFEFSERYRLPGPSTMLMLTPAWSCEASKCGFVKPVRRRMVSMNLRAVPRKRSGDGR